MAGLRRVSQLVKLLLEADRGAGDRYVDLAVSLRVADVETATDGTPRWIPETEETLLTVGGRYDRKRRRFIGRADTVLVLRVHRGQEAAARWLARWFRGRITGRWGDFRRVYSALFLGGRRSGKTHLSCAALVLYAVAFPRALVWAVSPTQEETDELEQTLRAMLPRGWYTYRGGGSGKSVSMTLPHGARLLMLSGHKPSALKRGRVDFVLYNESQKQHRSGYIQLRGAIADRGGLVLLAANPPDSPIGRWVEEHYEQTKAGKIESEVFDLDPRDNPWIVYATLESLKDEVDEVTYNREVLGLMQPIGDVVMHAWSDRESWRDPAPGWVDITPEFTKRHFGAAYGYVVLADFQQTPAMVATVAKVFRDPAFPDEEIFHVVDEVVIEHADEHDLIDELEATPRWTPEGRVVDDGYRGWRVPPDPTGQGGDDPAHPVHCCVVMDASAWWQDGAHTKGRTSDQVFRARKWTHLFKPQKDSDKNPDILERCKATNSRLKAASGRRRLFVARHCVRTARAMKLWENRHGVPYRRSPYAHLCDTVSYGVYRCWGRPKVKGPSGGYQSVRRHGRRDQFKGF